MTTNAECYDYPRYWDIAFHDETLPEADFIRRVATRYCPFPVRRVLEVGCGGGRQTMELARRGYQVTAFDLNETCVKSTRQRLRSRKLSAKVIVADMAGFSLPPTFELFS